MTTPLSSFEIGTTSTTANVESLVTPLKPPKSEFIEFSQDIELASGGVRGAGWTAATWTWGFLTQAQYTQMLSFMSGAKSDAVYIVTKTDHETFVKYSCTIIRPSRVERSDGNVLNVTFEFRNLVAV